MMLYKLTSWVYNCTNLKSDVDIGDITLQENKGIVTKHFVTIDKIRNKYNYCYVFVNNFNGYNTCVTNA